MNKFIYIIEDCDSGFIKIGRSTNPETRLKKMQSGSSGILRLVDKFQVGSNKAEKHIHKELKEYHRNGEWFDVPIELATDTVNRIIEDYQEDDSCPSFGDLAKDRDMTGESLRLMLLLISDMDSNKYIKMSQMEISDALGIARSSICRAMKILTSKNIVIVSGKGTNLRYRINLPCSMWQGKSTVIEGGLAA